MVTMMDSADGLRPPLQRGGRPRYATTCAVLLFNMKRQRLVWVKWRRRFDTFRDQRKLENPTNQPSHQTLFFFFNSLRILTPKRSLQRSSCGFRGRLSHFYCPRMRFSTGLMCLCRCEFCFKHGEPREWAMSVVVEGPTH